jgi:signal transduction histidine kinase
MVVLPTILLAWLAVRGVRDEQRRVAGQLRAAAESRAAGVDDRVQRVLDDRRRRLAGLELPPAEDPQAWRELVRTTPEIAGVAVQDLDGRLIHPPLAAGVSESERDFLVRIRQVLEDGLLGVDNQETQKMDRLRKYSQPPVAHGWYAWYWDTGLHLLFWRREPAGHLVAIELDRARLLADVLVELSVEPPVSDSSVVFGQVVLEDSQGRVLSQSGLEPNEKGSVDSVERRLSAPLAAWNLRVEYQRGTSLGVVGRFLWVAGFLMAAVLFGGLAFVFHRESSRELREASERVGFVNQVSHELRTPLTNIRLYAELLERRLEGGDDESRSYIDVIVAESGRLSRLIGNVLSFARRNRGALVVHPVEGVIDETLRSVAEQFRPSLAAKRVEVVLDLAAPRPIAFDPDAIEQVVGNLLNNVEKYAAAGGLAEVVSRQTETATVIRVTDRGPGIPGGREEKIFEPFVRLSDRLTEGVSGTGIGLSIARELVLLHGGELRLVPAGEGARFELELPDRPEGVSP